MIHRMALPPGFHKVFNVVTSEEKFVSNCFQRCADCLTCFERTGPWCIIEKIK